MAEIELYIRFIIGQFTAPYQGIWISTTYNGFVLGIRKNIV
jgi:hypothetical protein